MPQKPKTVYTEDTNVTFINPYNFVRTDNKVRRSTPEKGHNSGKISCILTTKTPLAFPDHESSEIDVNEHKKTHFYSIDGEPVITGSELRGMIRSDYETITNSCFSVNNNNILSARNTFPKKPGILQFDLSSGQWKLFEARKNKKPSPGSVKREWYTIDGKKKTEFYFSSTGTEIQCANLNIAVENYNHNVKIYCDADAKFKRVSIEPKKDGKEYPVFYDTVENYGANFVYLSPAQIGRTVFDNRLDDLLGLRKKCSEPEKLCDACSLFGFIGKKNKARASSVRFSDAKLNDGQADVFEKNKTLKELAGPKITSLEFYTNRPSGAKFWNYDYEVSGYGAEKDALGRKVVFPVCHMLMQNGKTALLRGRKHYLHSLPDYVTSEKTKRNITTDLVKPGTEFRFDVYFDNITDEQLAKLAWTLCIGDANGTNDLMHKLGHGKPLGLGSVKIKIEDIILRRFDLSAGKYAVENVDIAELVDSAKLDKDADYFKDYLMIKNFGLLGGRSVSYPLAENLTSKPENRFAAHQWFTANRAMGQDATSTKWNINHTLPAISDASLSLNKIIISKEFSEGFSGRNNGNDTGRRQTVSGTRENKPGYNTGKRFDESKFTFRKTYDAVYKDSYTKNGVKYANITVNGENASVPARVLPWGIRPGDTVCVRYDGMSGIFPKFFVIR